MSEFDAVSVATTDAALARDPELYRVIRVGGPYPWNYSMQAKRDVPNIEHVRANMRFAIDEHNRSTLLYEEVHAYVLRTLDERSRTAIYEHAGLHKALHHAFSCGHEASPENTYRSHGRPFCRTCQLERSRYHRGRAAYMRRYRARKRQSYAAVSS